MIHSDNFVTSDLDGEMASCNILAGLCANKGPNEKRSRVKSNGKLASESGSVEDAVVNFNQIELWTSDSPSTLRQQFLEIFAPS